MKYPVYYKRTARGAESAVRKKTLNLDLQQMNLTLRKPLIALSKPLQSYVNALNYIMPLALLLAL